MMAEVPGKPLAPGVVIVSRISTVSLESNSSEPDSSVHGTPQLDDAENGTN